MLREQNASKLATVGLQRSVAEKERDEAKLLSIRRREITEKMEKMRKYTSARYVNYYIQNKIYILCILFYSTTFLHFNIKERERMVHFYFDV